jgi:dienelactone hydrolase
MSSDIREYVIDGIPVSLARPAPGVADRGRLVVWLPWFTGTRQLVHPQLRVLAGRGFVAASLDPWRHGERADTSMEDLFTEVFAHFRREMWPILGQTTMDTMHVVDRLLAEYELGADVRAGGISMGGDIAVALAGVDRRVTAVAALVATPDWTRPGMHDARDPVRVIDQGAPSPYGRWLYEHLDPATHLDGFARAPRILFELGGADTHVPPAGAVAFRTAMAVAHPAAAEAITIRIADGVGHEAGDEAAIARALDWLSA